MKLAFFSPLPPAKSGIADYSAALLNPLSRMARVETISQPPLRFESADFDVCLYQLGNNPYHTFAYEAAMKHPGILVLHEANLHHLITDLTIRRNDWDAYIEACAVHGGSHARDYAERFVRTKKRGPQYEIPMLRAVLSKARGVVVHSHYVAGAVRQEGYEGPISVIPHGAWIPSCDRMGFRTKLGISERAPLIGIFGFLKPYKRIAEALRAFKRLIKLHPEARMILVGEAHPALPLANMVSSLGLSSHVRHIDYAPIDDFNGYMAACDIVLNLRYPTVGETSGTLLRALGLGKAVVVSDVGAFSEYPDDICLKAPVDRSEEEHLFEFLNLLTARPETTSALGQKARQWVEQNCSWEHVARRYHDFLQAIASGAHWEDPVLAPESRAVATPAATPESAQANEAAAQEPEPPAVESTVVEPPVVEPGYIASWTPPEDSSRTYVETHITRLEKTLSVTPRGGRGDRILEMGAYLQITPSLHTRLGYGEVRGCYYGKAGEIDHRTATSESGETFSCEIDLFDAEKDVFPYPDDHFSTVLCCELLEHLPNDPMHMMGEINRILKPGGYLVLTTPNIVSLRAISGILQGFHPQFFSSYIRPRNGVTDARHMREYTPHEIQQLLEVSGFDVTLLETGPFLDEPKPEHRWVEHLLERYMLTQEHRGDGIYAVGRKSGPVRERYPDWLYD